MRAIGTDLAYVTAELVDRNGAPVYARSGDRMLKVKVRGPNLPPQQLRLHVLAN